MAPTTRISLKTSTTLVPCRLLVAQAERHQFDVCVFNGLVVGSLVEHKRVSKPLDGLFSLRTYKHWEAKLKSNPGTNLPLAYRHQSLFNLQTQGFSVLSLAALVRLRTECQILKFPYFTAEIDTRRLGLSGLGLCKKWFKHEKT